MESYIFINKYAYFKMVIINIPLSMFSQLVAGPVKTITGMKYIKIYTQIIFFNSYIKDCYHNILTFRTYLFFKQPLIATDQGIHCRSLLQWQLTHQYILLILKLCWFAHVKISGSECELLTVKVEHWHCDSCCRSSLTCRLWCSDSILSSLLQIN